LFGVSICRALAVAVTVQVLVAPPFTLTVLRRHGGTEKKFLLAVASSRAAEVYDARLVEKGGEYNGHGGL
jgi:hypothetical protein